MSRLFCAILVMMTGYQIVGQNLSAIQENKEILIKRTTGQITVDGILDEVAWNEADLVDDFWLKFPRDDRPADARTAVRMTYDDDFLYISAVCYDVQEYVVKTLKRDFEFFEGDGFGIVIDPINSKANGFLFGVSPYNVQAEDMLGANAPGELSFSWDDRWYSSTTRLEDRYIVEIAIPFKTLRFKKGIEVWGINFFRNDISRNQFYSWKHIPVNFELFDIGYTGSLKWDAAPPKSGMNISLLPYINSGVVKDRESENNEIQYNADAGIDAKIGITSSLNLDLTVNPDFSQVDVDVQQTNLTRFSLSLPEQRGFFLENNDLFTDFGAPGANPIFTRRIGLDNFNNPVPILYGARLSGNLSQKLRIGLLNLQTNPGGASLSQNYSIATFNQSIFARSLIKGYLTNRQTVLESGGLDEQDFGRNAGLELNFLNKSGSWNYFAAFHLSQKPEIDIGTFLNAKVEYAGREWKFFVDYWNISSDYYADIGFTPRLNYYDLTNDSTVHLGLERLYTRAGYVIRPSNGIINKHDIELRNLMDFYPDKSLNERESRFDYAIEFKNLSRASFQARNSQTQLLYFTNFTGFEPLPPGFYDYSAVTISYSSDYRKAFSYKTVIDIGEYYNGHLNRYVAEVIYRRQPWGNMSVALEQNNLKLPAPYGERSITLINGRTDINLSTKFFWTTFFQYNTQGENFNINSRLQWRYRTMSDIFLVYSDNYGIFPLFSQNKNRALLLKVTYMLNL